MNDINSINVGDIGPSDLAGKQNNSWCPGRETRERREEPRRLNKRLRRRMMMQRKCVTSGKVGHEDMMTKGDNG